MRVFIILGVITLVLGKPYSDVSDEPVCGYDSCHPLNQSKINVHIVPHSHDDVGWLQTVDGYYYTEVQQILSSVVNALLENPDRRFIQVETAFFYMWWNYQNDEIKTVFKQLINEGRLEIVNGAWSMNDEAAVHYQSTIDQYTLGLKFVQDNLGTCARPKTSWQVDTFGHSREQASLLSQFGMDGLFFARFDYRDRAKRLENKNMEMLWTGSENLGSDSNIFTSALYNHYSSPPSFCFDILCQDDPIVTEEDSFEYNWETKVQQFADFIKSQSQYYSTNNIIITMGDDFHYQAASNVYTNLDKLIEGFKKFNPKVDDKEINLIYSTPSCYTKAVHDYVQANKLTMDVKTDDFFPYADGSDRVWTGFFSSRPSSKKLERVSNNLLQVSKQLSALSGRSYKSSAPLSQAMGVIQHHDAITGTELDFVQKDYHRLLARGIEKVTPEVARDFKTILDISDDLNLVSCPQLNVSICSVANETEYNIIMYNPLGRNVSHYIQVPVQNVYRDYEVQTPTGEVVESVTTYLMDDLDEDPKSLPGILIFKAEDLPALGYRVYNIKETEEVSSRTKVVEAVEQMGFTDTYVNFDKSTGYLKSITLFDVTVEVTQQFLYYKSSGVSNAYIFRPDDNERDAIELKLIENTVLANSGNLVREVLQTFEGNISQIIRIYKDEDFIEFDWLVGPQYVSDSGREIITRYTTKLENPSDQFFTDSNGREMIHRQKNYRPTYDYTDEEPQSGNYYPVNTRIVIKNSTHEFAVLTDRSEGGSSLNLGEIELMVARQIPDSCDQYEYGHPVNTRGSHYVTYGVSDNANGGRTMAALERDIAQRKHLQPWLFFTTDSLPNKEQSFLSKELPSNIHLLTLESWDSLEDIVLIRLEHILEKDEDPELSQETYVDLTGLFKTFTINSMKEYMLAANIPLEESDRLTWDQLEAMDPSSVLSKTQRLTRDESYLNITLAPMQIRTFIANVTYV